MPTGDGLSVNYRGSCILVDSGFVLSKQKRRGFRAGYKVPQQPKQLY